MVINHSGFQKKLQAEFNSIPKLITEDLIRYWFIENQKLNLSNTVIEKPYRGLLGANSSFNGAINNRARADLYYKDVNEENVIEFKYHKKIDTSDTAKTDNMGEVFRDLNRLSILGNKKKYLVYVFDKEMQDYYIFKNNQYQNNLNFFLQKGTYHIGAKIDSLGLEKSILDTAFSCFSASYNSFANFDYEIDVLYCNPIISGQYYTLIIQVS